MATAIPDDLGQLIDGRVFAHVATVGRDGWPQCTAMWIARDHDYLLLNTAVGRVKWRNLRRDPRLGISISPPDRPYVNYSIKGRVVEMRTSDADEVIDALARKYLGAEHYPKPPGEARVTIVVEPVSIVAKR